jgi:hypothetical protein
LPERFEQASHRPFLAQLLDSQILNIGNVGRPRHRRERFIEKRF